MICPSLSSRFAASHRADGTGGVKDRRHHQRQHAWQHDRVERADDIRLPIKELPAIAQGWHSENAGEMDVGIENQADNRHADNGQQNAARHLHFPDQ